MAKSLNAPKDSPSPNLILIHGSDEGKVKEETAKMVKLKSPGDGDPFGTDIIDGTADHVEHALSIIQTLTVSLQTLPFFGEKLVWLKNPNFLSEETPWSNESIQQALVPLIQLIQDGIPSQITFLLNPVKISKLRAFYKALSSKAVIHAYDLPESTNRTGSEPLKPLILKLAKEKNLDFEPAALDLFLILVGSNSLQIRNEIEKIDLALGLHDRTVTEKTVSENVSRTKAGIIWELGTHLGSRDLASCFELLNQLIIQKETPVGILLAGIVPKIRSLLTARMLLDHARPPSQYQAFQSWLEQLPPELNESLPRNKKDKKISAYPLFLSLKEAASFSTEELILALEFCLETNRAMFSTQIDAQGLLQILLTRILSRDKTSPKRVA